jgi:hypothetical protein
VHVIRISLVFVLSCVCSLINAQSTSGPCASAYELAALEFFPDVVGGAVVPGMVYAARDDGHLQAYRMLGDGLLEEAGQYTSFGNCIDAVANGSIVYAAFEGSVGSVNIVDFADPEHPIWRGSYSVPPHDPVSIALEDGYLVVAWSDDSVRVYDTNQGVYPPLYSTVQLEGPLIAANMSGNTLAVATLNSELVVFDLSDPTQPYMIGDALVLDRPKDLAFLGDELIVTTDTAINHFVVEGSGVSLAGSCPIPGQSEGMIDDGSGVFVSVRDHGIFRFEFNALGQLSQTRSFGSARHTGWIDAYGDTLYYADLDRGLGAISLRRTGNEILQYASSLGEIEYMEDGLVVAVAPQRVRIANYDTHGGIGPTVSELPFAPVIDGADVEGDRLYVSRGGLHVYDIQDPSSPAGLGVYDELGALGDVKVRDGYAYVTKFGLRAIDARDPQNMAQVFYENHTLGYSWLHLEGDRLYLVSSSRGTFVYDISDPAMPQLIGEVESIDSAYPVHIEDSILYVAADDERIDGYDVRDPSTPELVLTLHTGCEAQSMDRFSETIVVDTDCGLMVFDLALPLGDRLRLTTLGSRPALRRPRIIGDLAFVPDSDDAIAVVHLSALCGICPADLNADGSLNFFDVSAFLVGYLGQDASGDWNNDGVWDFFDVSAFLGDYTLGCP